jgi:hypothetical protein
MDYISVYWQGTTEKQNKYNSTYSTILKHEFQEVKFNKIYAKPIFPKYKIALKKI